jgi:hypothetical protein
VVTGRAWPLGEHSWHYSSESHSYAVNETKPRLTILTDKNTLSIARWQDGQLISPLYDPQRIEVSHIPLFEAVKALAGVDELPFGPTPASPRLNNYFL